MRARHGRTRDAFGGGQDAPGIRLSRRSLRLNDSGNFDELSAMGQRLRLKASFVIPKDWTIEEKAILLGLKKYGAIVADNSGGFFSISVSPDDRWPANCFDHLATISIDNFEVIQKTGPTEGPRSSNAPTVDAGSNQVIEIDGVANLRAIVTAPNGG